MHDLPSKNMASATPEGIPISELTYGTAVSLAELFIPYLGYNGCVNGSEPEQRNDVVNSISCIINVMPWGVLAASCIKLCTHLIGFLDNQDAFRITTWSIAKDLISGNTIQVALFLGIDSSTLSRYLQTFVNESLLSFLVGEDIQDIVSPQSLQSTEYEYAVVLAILSLSIICATSTIMSSKPENTIDGLQKELTKISSQMQ